MQAGGGRHHGATAGVQQHQHTDDPAALPTLCNVAGLIPCSPVRFGKALASASLIVSAIESAPSANVMPNAAAINANNDRNR